MEQRIDIEVLQKLKQKKRRRVWARIVSTMVCIVVFCTTYALILPAITKETETFCGIEAHTHDEACYEEVLLCQEHVHTQACYEIHEHLICAESTEPGHVHSEECGPSTESILTCGLEETQGHVHTESCEPSVVTNLTCGQEESEGHIHTESCSKTEMLLSCELEESDSHSHSDNCFSAVTTNVCGQEEIPAHVHTDECYTDVTVYGCGLEETEGHSHNSECYTSVTTYSCGEEEIPTHVHTETCYEYVQEQICALDANPEHQHTAECYGQKLICELPEHVHSLVCFADPTADLETAANWTATLPAITGNYAQDVLAIAGSQLGYTESTRNYIVNEDNSLNGYTRYGAWYGSPYGDWCAMFVSFCLHYAGVEEVPLDANCPNWIKQLQEADMYELSGNYEPVGGDIIFFDWDADNESDHVGLVAEFVPATDTSAAMVRTIEGNSSNTVRYNTYNLADTTIMGYGLLPIIQEATAEDDPLINQSGTLMYHHEDHLEYQYSAHRVDDYMTLTYVLIPYEEKDTWKPNMLQWSANAGANYVVTYCAARDIWVSEVGEQYVTKEIHELETYAPYEENLAGIIGHAYPFITAEEMRQELANAYAAGEIAIDLSCCVESDYIAAAQWAVWDATRLSGVQTEATEAYFPVDPDTGDTYNRFALNPLTNVGHTDAETVQSHIKAIRDWLIMQQAPGDLEIANHTSTITQNEDGTYNVQTLVKLDRALEEKEKLSVTFSSGDHVQEISVTEAGLDEFTVSLEGLTQEEVLAATVKLNVSFEHMQVFVYDSGSYQDMIGGQWGEETYELSFEIEAETTSVDVTKIWSDNEIGAEYIEVQLYADGEKYGAPQKLSTDNDWTYTWEELLKYSQPDEEIEYTVKEVLVPGYYSSIVKDDSGGGTATTVDVAAAFEEGGIYVLTYDGGVNGLADAGGTLDWVRELDLSKPESVPESALWTASDVSSDGVSAYLRNNATGNYLAYNGTYIILGAEASAKTYFLYDHLYLLKGDYNQYLIYLNDGSGYTTNVWDDALNVSMYKYTQVQNASADISFQITNTKTTVLTSVSVSKEWAGRSDEKYPESIQVNLLQNGQIYGDAVTLNEENGWYYRWEDLPLELGTNRFTYSIEEIAVKDYTPTVETSADEDGTILFKLCNTWSPEYALLELIKTDLNKTGKQLSGAQFQLYLAVAEGTEDAVAVPGEENAFGILKQEVTTGEEGKLRIEELLVDEIYYLVETQAPMGYNLLQKPVVIKTEKDADGQTVLTVLSDEFWASSSGTDADGTLQLQVFNEQRYELPKTGGSGTQMYTTVGLLLMLISAAFLMYINKKGRGEDYDSS